MFRGNPPTEEQAQTQTQFFFASWVTAIFYGGRWHDVQPGSFKEGIGTDHGEMAVYKDTFNLDEVVFITEPITGYKVKEPQQEVKEEPPPPTTVVPFRRDEEK